MAEYYAVLSKAVAGLEANSADTRRAVYDKARNALIGQLKAIDPPLPTADISRQRLELEEAIRRVEREASAVPAGAPVRVAGARPQTARPQAERAPRQSPQDVFRRAIQEAERDSSDSAPVERAPVAARADDWSSDRIERPPPARTRETYLPSQGYVEDEPRADEPRLAPDYDYEWDPNAAPKPAAATLREIAPAVDARDRAGRPKRDRRDLVRDDDADVLERRARPSRLPMILLLVLIIAMLGGLGALGYSQRAVIADLLHGFDSKLAAPVVAITPPADTSGKNTDSLLGSGQSTDQTTALAPAANDVRVVTPGGGDAAGNPAAATVPAASPGLLPDATAAATPTAPAADALVAQKATLYEEPVNSAAAASGVVAINAAVTWSLAQASDGAEIVGNIDVPDRGMKIKLTIRRNADKTLPASHVVEVVLETPTNFPGKGIRDVPRIVMKPAEDARGQPLIGASAKVADGFFWVALSGVDTDVTANLRLLKDREWFDLPLVYESGQRAIVTFEKGTPGDRVFNQALSAWTAG
jgi:hypothetical protein